MRLADVRFFKDINHQSLINFQFSSEVLLEGNCKEGQMSRTLASGIFSVVMILAVTASARAPQGTGGASRKVTKEQFEQWKKDLNNWGRWGRDDEIGTMNLITPAKRKQAAG